MLEKYLLLLKLNSTVHTMQCLLFNILRRDDDDCNAPIEGDRAVPSVSVNDEELSKTTRESAANNVGQRMTLIC